MVPELALAAKAAQLDHRQREIETVALGLLHDLAVQRKGRHVLRRRGRDQPSVVADRDENAEFHGHSCAGTEPRGAPYLISIGVRSWYQLWAWTKPLTLGLSARGLRSWLMNTIHAWSTMRALICRR